LGEPDRVLDVIRLFEQGKDARQIAEELGYENPRSISTLMRRHGYKWDPEVQNYVRVGPTGPHRRPSGTLEDRADELLRLLDWFRGMEAGMALSNCTVRRVFILPRSVDEQLWRFSLAHNRSEDEVLTAAVTEFLRKARFRGGIGCGKKN